VRGSSRRQKSHDQVAAAVEALGEDAAAVVDYAVGPAPLRAPRMVVVAADELMIFERGADDMPSLLVAAIDRDADAYDVTAFVEQHITLDKKEHRRLMAALDRVIVPASEAEPERHPQPAPPAAPLPGAALAAATPIADWLAAEAAEEAEAADAMAAPAPFDAELDVPPVTTEPVTTEPVPEPAAARVVGPPRRILV
jgi:hypothetical protein